MDLVRFCLMVTLMIPSVIELYVMISVACCGWPIYFRVVLSASNYLALYNNSPHSASADDVITRYDHNCSIWSADIIAPPPL